MYRVYNVNSVWSRVVLTSPDVISQLHVTVHLVLLPVVSHCSLYIHCTIYIVHCTVYIVQYTLYIVHCTLYYVYCLVANVVIASIDWICLNGEV